jgi:hypothetical protein
MNEAQRLDLQTAANACARALGADLKPEGTQAEARLEGWAWMLARMVKKPEAALAFARYAARYMETVEPVPTAAPTATGAT